MTPELNALDLDGPWRLGEKSFELLVEDLKAVAPTQIVEFGSGASSIRLAQAFPEAHILSIDHDPEYFAKTRALLAAHPELENLTISLRPLKWQLLVGSLFYSYALGALPRTIDAVLIDGPPRRYLGGREACFYQVYERLRVGGRVYLDDSERHGELRAVSNWLYRYKQEMGEGVRFLYGRHHVCVFEKRRHVLTPRKNVGLRVENTVSGVRNVSRALRRRLKRES